MITLNNVNKYYNKGKKNQIHVINNTSLTLEDTGLVALLGPSGCGKTTLLNSIGGLDKVKKGSIYINDKKINSRFSNKVDKIRNLNIGYIFQDYKLIDNMSVYDNVKIVLTMIGLKDKEEINKRVLYVLDKVGMLRYKYRPCSMLSGGERQRVGIARAIVKDPSIILADEPTGNLDSKNSLEIMKIIKAISKDKLVILVTHEQDLARFYASRIIEIEDGKIIKDYENNSNNELDYTIDNTFYLKDFEINNSYKDDNIDLDVYKEDNKKIKLDIVVKNGNIYIKSNSKEKIEVVDENSNISFINEHYKKIDKKDIDKYNFDFKNIINNNFKKKYSSILNPISLLINGFKKVFDFSILKKLLLVGFLLSGMFVVYGVSSIASTLKIEDENFIEKDRNYLSINLKKIDVDNYLEYEKLNNIEYIIPGNSIANFDFAIKDYYQTYQYVHKFSASLSSLNTLKDSDLILGNMPKEEYEIVLDKLLIERILKNDTSYKMMGIKDYYDMLGKTLSIDKMKDFKIVGISTNITPTIYVSENLLINILYNTSSEDDYYSDTQEISNYQLVDYELYKDDITIKKGKMPTNDYEIIVNINNQYSMTLNKEIDVKVNDKKLKVVGYYESENNYNYYFTNNNTIKYDLIKNSENISIYTYDKESIINEFRNLNLNVKDTYLESKNEYIKNTQEKNNSTLLLCSIILIISFVEMYLMTRSSFLSRIKEIGILRAIGVKKRDIYKMFYGEIIAITTLTSLPGVILMSYILYNISKISYLNDMFIVNPITVTISIVSIYIFNLIVGLIPVFNVVKKTPASILARHDLD